MPGITGIITARPSEAAAFSVEAMVKCMRHEQHYCSGHLAHPPLNLAAGWVCLQGSFADCMPAWNETHDVCLIFWGEHFGNPLERESFQRAGQHWSGSSASELLHLYEKQRTEFLQKLNGTFCGLLIDVRENKAVLFNDRYGLARIYYHENTSGFYFSSEAKSILNAVAQVRRFDMRSLGEFFSCGCVLQNRTLFEGVSLLPPGSAWTFRPGGAVQKDCYFRKDEWEQLPQLMPEDYYRQLKETFTRILPQYMNGKQRVALSLTGGLDSRMIIAAAPRAAETFPCYTFGGMYRDCEDVRVGQQVAAVCCHPHNVIKVDQSFFPEFLSAAQKCVHITDGAMDVSGAVGVYVNKKAREFAPIRMTGNYGSEILRLNVAFKAGYVGDEIFDGSFKPSLHQAADTFDQERRGHKLSFIAFKQVPWHHYSRFAEESSQLTIRSPYLDNELVRLAYQAPPGLLLHKHLALRYCSELKPALQSVPTDRGTLDRPAIVPEKVYQLWKERWPRMEYYFDYGMPQWLARFDRLAPVRLERFFLGQQKYYHFRTWYRHQLAPVVREVLLDPTTLSRAYLDKRRVQQIVDAHTKGTGNYTLEIHKLMTAEFIQRGLISCP